MGGLSNSIHYPYKQDESSASPLVSRPSLDQSPRSAVKSATFSFQLENINFQPEDQRQIHPFNGENKEPYTIPRSKFTVHVPLKIGPPSLSSSIEPGPATLNYVSKNPLDPVERNESVPYDSLITGIKEGSDDCSASSSVPSNLPGRRSTMPIKATDEGLTKAELDTRINDICLPWDTPSSTNGSTSGPYTTANEDCASQSSDSSDEQDRSVTSVESVISVHEEVVSTAVPSECSTTIVCSSKEGPSRREPSTTTRQRGTSFSSRPRMKRLRGYQGASTSKGRVTIPRIDRNIRGYNKRKRLDKELKKLQSDFEALRSSFKNYREVNDARRAQIAEKDTELVQVNLRLDEYIKDYTKLEEFVARVQAERRQEIAWRHDILEVQVDDLLSLMKTIWRPSLDQREAIVRLLNYIEMQNQQYEHVISGLTSPLPSVSEKLQNDQYDQKLLGRVKILPSIFNFICSKAGYLEMVDAAIAQRQKGKEKLCKVPSRSVA